MTTRGSTLCICFCITLLVQDAVTVIEKNNSFVDNDTRSLFKRHKQSLSENEEASSRELIRYRREKEEAEATTHPLKNNSGKMTGTSWYGYIGTNRNCSVLVQQSSQSQSLIVSLSDKSEKLIRFNLHFTGNPNDDNLLMGVDLKHHRLYKPLTWYLSKGDEGTNLLMLRDYFQAYSLSTLSVGVVRQNVSIFTTGKECMTQMHRSVDLREKVLRHAVMCEFKNTSLSETVEQFNTLYRVCNEHVFEENGQAVFRYFCCHVQLVKSSDFLNIQATKDMRCSYLETNKYVNLLFLTIVTLKIIAILFAPTLLPKSIFEYHRTCTAYLLRNRPNTKDKTTLANNSAMIISATEMPWTSLYVDYPKGGLISTDDKPLGPFVSLFNFLTTYVSDRSARRKTTTCKVSVTYIVLKQFRRLLFCLFFLVPWVFRLYMYYIYEQNEETSQRQAAQELSLSREWSESLIRFYSPTHPLFLAMYAVLVLGMVSLVIIKCFTTNCLPAVQLFVARAFLSMKERNIKFILILAKRVFDIFFSVGDFLGCLIFILFVVLTSPLWIWLLGFYIFPTFNLSIQLIARLVVYIFPGCFERMTNYFERMRKHYIGQKCENVEEVYADANGNDKTVTDLFIQRLSSYVKSLREMNDRVSTDETLHNAPIQTLNIVCLLLWLFILWSVVFLFGECISFVVEVILYTLIGIVLNSDAILAYLSVFVTLVVYGRRCYGSVQEEYIGFKRILLKYMKAIVTEKGTVKLDDYQRKEIVNFNLQFHEQIVSDVSVNDFCKVDSGIGLPLKNGLLFINEKGRLSVPNEFFYRVCENKRYLNAPGCLLVRYLRATIELIFIFMFMWFVLTVVASFGSCYGLSATNQAVATLIGGVIPYILTRFVFNMKKEVNWEDEIDEPGFKQLVQEEIRKGFEIRLKVSSFEDHEGSKHELN